MFELEIVFDVIEPIFWATDLTVDQERAWYGNLVIDDARTFGSPLMMISHVCK